MDEVLNRMDVLQSLLRAPLQISEVKRQVFPRQWTTPDAVIVTHRLILICKGAMDYRVDGVRQRLTEGAQFFVPAWSRREWMLPKGAGECSLAWCSFSSGSMTLPSILFSRRPGKLRTEITAFEAMRKTMVSSTGERSSALLLEGALKACLARFWSEAQATHSISERITPKHPEVARAIGWLEQHYAESDALDAFYRTVEMSPNHFRLLFRRETGETVQAILARLRLRRARYLVQETAMPMKQISAETGYADPLYFSNQYRKFWGRAPTKDRVSGGVA